MNFAKGDFVKDAKGNAGKVTGTMGNGVYVFHALSGQNSFFDHPSPATKEEYDAQIEQRMHPQKTAKPASKVAAVPVVQPATKQTKRYLCLDCGTTHNSHVCPLCGSDEKIDNVDMRYRGEQ